VSLAPGTKLGPYEIGAPLGAGGMGEVYRARDTRLERTVAIKILPAQFSSDPIRKQRFEREAKTISSLNHPHICTLYDVGGQDGISYLVMECVEGETLAKRLEKGPLPLEQVLKYGAQIADALDKAHRSGVIHRDLKPGNVMLTAAGAKLLDFGLAKPVSPLAGSATLTAAVTQSSPMTEQGAIVGTFQYMSPEQVEGKELDGRSDIFSLGAVLYEMVTGQRAFQGKSQLSVASAILEKDPTPISTVKPLTPLSLDHAIRRCFAKDPEERWQTARDLALEIKWLAESSSHLSLPSTAPTHILRTRWGGAVVCGAVSLLLVAVSGLVVWNLKRSPSPLLVSCFTITLPPGQQLAGLDGGPAIALSPDGRYLAYVARKGGVQLLYLRPMDSLDARPIAGTEDAVCPFFSPDGQWLGFFAGNKLKKVSVNGGPAQTLGDVPMGRGASWSGQGMIALAPTNNSSLRQMPDAGRTARPVARFNKGEVGHRWPEFIPGGKTLLFAAAATNFNWNHAQVAVQSLSTGERRNLFQEATNPRYATSGHVIFSQGGTLVAAPFATWAPDGKRIAIQSNREGPLNIFWEPTDGSGGLERLLAYVSDESGRWEVYVQPYPGPGGKWQISTEGGIEPTWNPNGRELFYRSGDKMMAVDISTEPNFKAGKPKVLLRDATSQLPRRDPTTMFRPTASGS
jgi:eukaryotic-like serine/threonine-protein kinase